MERHREELGMLQTALEKEERALKLAEQRRRV